jgi:hypothetical protein
LLFCREFLKLLFLIALRKMENQTYNQEEQNITNENRGWDERMFSETCNKVLKNMEANNMLPNLYNILFIFMKYHPEYGNLSTNQNLSKQSKMEDLPIFREVTGFMSVVAKETKLPEYQSNEWANIVLSITKPSLSEYVVNGRMFIIAVILHHFNNEIYYRLNKTIDNLNITKKWYQMLFDFIDKLDYELKETEKIEFKSLLTEKGHSLLKILEALLIKEPKKSIDTLIDTANLSDGPTDKDSLSRNALAHYLAKRLRHIYNQDIGKKKYGSFFMHIDGAWGSGKSTLLGFIQEHLEKDATDDSETNKERTLSQKKWIIVTFNAWENQRLDPPWWFLMRSVYRTAMNSKGIIGMFRKLILFINEYLWRFNTGTNYLIAVLLTLGLFLTAVFFNIKSEKEWNELSFVQLITFIGFLWSLTKFLRTSLVPGSAKAAKAFIEENGKDPLQLLASHFIRQIERIKQPVAIFIDDLDRCNKDYGIKLLEGLQTIFRRAPVVYVVAADRKWLSKMYEDQYSSFANVIAKPAKPFGLVFLDKTFQLTLELPDISAVQKKIYWNDLLNISSDDSSENNKNVEEMKEKIKSAATNQQKMDIADKTTDNPKKQQIAREQAVSSLSIREEEKLIEHTLQKYVDLIEPNPRAMKRLINDISTANAITYLYNQQVGQEQLILWTILKLQYPSLAEFFWDHPAKISEVNGYTEARKPITNDDSLNTLLLKPEVQKLFRYQLDGSVVELDKDFLDKMQFRV